MIHRRHFILCNPCAMKLDFNDVSDIFLAMFGPQGRSEQDAVLACVLWEQRATRFASLATKHQCDGCKADVAVAPSSGWFIERHKAERA